MWHVSSGRMQQTQPGHMDKHRFTKNMLFSLPVSQSTCESVYLYVGGIRHQKGKKSFKPLCLKKHCVAVYLTNSVEVTPFCVCSGLKELGYSNIILNANFQTFGNIFFLLGCFFLSLSIYFELRKPFVVFLLNAWKHIIPLALGAYITQNPTDIRTGS